MHALTVRLAGTFTPTEELHRLAAHSSEVVTAVFERARTAGAIRADLAANDLPMIFEQLTAIQLPDPVRTRELRDRYLVLQLDALRATPWRQRCPTLRPPQVNSVGAGSAAEPLLGTVEPVPAAAGRTVALGW